MSQLITYAPQNALGTSGIGQTDLDELAPRLLDARREVLEEDLSLFASDSPIPAAKQPLDAGCIELPERLLREYCDDAEASELGRILRTAGRLAGEVDSVVVTGIGGSYMGTRALFEACCHPYHNELPRAARAGKPRLYFEGLNVDNDTLQGLLDLLRAADADWALIPISKSGGTLEPALATQALLELLRERCAGDADRLGRLFVPITGPEGRLRDLAIELGCADTFDVPDGVGGRFSVLTGVGLLPAACCGIDVVALLEGAAAMNEHFRTADPGANAVLDYVGVSHLMEEKRGATIRVLSIWSQLLESFGLWYDQLLSESLGKGGRGATPLTAVNSRDLHSRGQQHQDGRRDKLITNVVVHASRFDPLRMKFQVGSRWTEHTLPEVMLAASEGTNRAYAGGSRPTTNLNVPQVNEHTLGQLFQMMMLATVVEGRLIGINPYGQPGVEEYKARMQELL